MTLPALSTSSSQFASTSYLPTSLTRKRRAASPETVVSPWPIIENDHREKRRRPNLANGFSGLSINHNATPRADSPLPSYDESQAIYNEPDEALETSPQPFDVHDVRVEELPDKTRGYSTSSTESTSDDGYGSDVTFRLRGKRKARGRFEVAQQADVVEQPEDDVRVEEVHGRRKREDDVEIGGSKRFKEDVEMGKSRRKMEWHEPEKDRMSPLSTKLKIGIVITSIGSPTSSRESSPDHSRYLSQPGNKGFTISPSLLTHLLNSQREGLDMPFPMNGEKGLVLYRPTKLPAGWTDEIVKAWQQGLGQDEGRFEEVDEIGVDEIVADGLENGDGDDIGHAGMDMDEEMVMSGEETAFNEDMDVE